MRILDKDAKVKELIEREKGHWKKALIYEVFDGREAKVICSLPLSKMGLEDKVTWGLTKTGIFTIRSAYQLAVKKQRHAKGESSSSKGENVEWMKIWDLNVPNGVRVFIWKARSDALPTKKKLQ